MHTERARSRATLGDLPLVVISRAPAAPRDSLEVERVNQQHDLAALSRIGSVVTAAHAGHNVHLEEPAVVVQAIRKIVGVVRRGDRR